MQRTPLIIVSSLLVAACQEAAVCDEGNVERDGQCVPAAVEVRMTHLDVRYDLSQPVYVNNRIPITFGLTADSVDPANPATRSVAVTFSFVEADPTDPDNPLGCSSSAIDVEVTGDGSEQLVDGFIWPTTLCTELAAKNGPVNLQVDFTAAFFELAISGSPPLRDDRSQPAARATTPIPARTGATDVGTSTGTTDVGTSAATRRWPSRRWPTSCTTPSPAASPAATWRSCSKRQATPGRAGRPLRVTHALQRQYERSRKGLAGPSS